MKGNGEAKGLEGQTQKQIESVGRGMLQLTYKVAADEAHANAVVCAGMMNLR